MNVSGLIASGNRFLPAVIVLLSTTLIWWSVMVRLTGASAAELVEQRQRNIEFTLTTLSGQRDSLSTALQESGWSEVERRLVPDPAGLVPLLDELLEISTELGMNLRYDVGELSASTFDPAVGWRPVQLEFNRARYEQLLRLLAEMDQIAQRRLFSISELALVDRARDGSLTGRLMVSVWTKLDTPRSGPMHLEF